MLLVYETDHGRGMNWLSPGEATEMINLGHLDPQPCTDRNCPLDHSGPAHHPMPGVHWPDRFQIGQPGGQTNGALDQIDIPFTH